MSYSQKCETLPVGGKAAGIKAAPGSSGRYGEQEETWAPERLWEDDELLTQYYKDVTRYLGVFHIGKRDIEDAVQDTMIEALEGAESIRDKSKSKYWILTIAKRIGLKYYGRIQEEKAQCLSYEEYIENYREDLDFTSDRQLFECVSRIGDEELYELLHTVLSERERKVILLYYVYEQKLRDIARILNEPESTIRSLSARAKKKLRARLEEGGRRYGR